MHILILSKRNGEAQQKLLTAAAALATYFSLAPDLVQALAVQEKDPQVRALREREACATLLEQIAYQVGAMTAPVEPPVTTETASDAVTAEGDAPPALEIVSPDGSIATVSVEIDESAPVEPPVDEDAKPKRTSKKKS